MTCFNTNVSAHTALSLSPSSTMRQSCNTHCIVPHGGQYDLVEQVVVELLGHFEAGPLHSHRGGQTQDDAQAAQYAEHRQIPRVTEATVLQHRERVIEDRTTVQYFVCVFEIAGAFLLLTLLGLQLQA